ncbi:hypothetical protein [Oscillatoria acuminata]|uniref:hypothetical protein n=1 Tax=Oscillatoria acuminata TaxID=118323 RepID=UPI00030D7C52|nr:hypothetical protein [Oscillatoria acuminata]
MSSRANAIALARSKDVFPASIQALKPLRMCDVAIAQEEPHPNPPLAKGRGPET